MAAVQTVSSKPVMLLIETKTGKLVARGRSLDYIMRMSEFYHSFGSQTEIFLENRLELE
jgi:hypothetical protein